MKDRQTQNLLFHLKLADATTVLLKAYINTSTAATFQLVGKNLENIWKQYGSIWWWYLSEDSSLTSVLRMRAKNRKDFHRKVVNMFHYGFSVFCLILSLFIKNVCSSLKEIQKLLLMSGTEWFSNDDKSTSILGLTLPFRWDNLKLNSTWQISRS